MGQFVIYFTADAFGKSGWTWQIHDAEKVVDESVHLYDTYIDAWQKGIRYWWKAIGVPEYQDKPGN